MGKFVKGMMMGLVVGAAAEVMMMPYQDKRTKRTMKRAARKVINLAESTYDGIHDWRR